MVVPSSEKDKAKYRERYGFCYGLRHHDNDCTEPVSVESNVLVNRFGYLFTNSPISGAMGPNNFLELTPDERILLRDAAEGR